MANVYIRFPNVYRLENQALEKYVIVLKAKMTPVFERPLLQMVNFLLMVRNVPVIMCLLYLEMKSQSVTLPNRVICLFIHIIVPCFDLSTKLVNYNF